MILSVDVLNPRKQLNNDSVAQADVERRVGAVLDKIIVNYRNRTDLNR